MPRTAAGFKHDQLLSLLLNNCCTLLGGLNADVPSHVHAACSEAAHTAAHVQRGHESQAVKSTSLPGLVECLVKIGGIADAQAVIHQRLAAQVTAGDCVHVCWANSCALPL